MMQLLFKIPLTFLILTTVSYADLTIAYAHSVNSNENKVSQKRQVELDKLSNIAKKENVKISFIGRPWKRALLMVEKGKVDGVINASYKQDRAKYALYPMKEGEPDSSKRLNDGNSYYIYRNINSPLRWDGKVFFKTGKIGVMSKYAVIEDLKKHTNIQIEEFHNNTELIRKVANGELDAYAGVSVLADNMLKQFPSLGKNIIKEPVPIRKKEYFLIFSKKLYNKKSTQMEAIWNGLQKFNENQ